MVLCKSLELTLIPLYNDKEIGTDLLKHAQA